MEWKCKLIFILSSSKGNFRRLLAEAIKVVAQIPDKSFWWIWWILGSSGDRSLKYEAIYGHLVSCQKAQLVHAHSMKVPCWERTVYRHQLNHVESCWIQLVCICLYLSRPLFVLLSTPASCKFLQDSSQCSVAKSSAGNWFCRFCSTYLWNLGFYGQFVMPESAALDTVSLANCCVSLITIPRFQTLSLPSCSASYSSYSLDFQVRSELALRSCCKPFQQLCRHFIAIPRQGMMSEPQPLGPSNFPQDPRDATAQGVGCPCGHQLSWWQRCCPSLGAMLQRSQAP